MRLLIRILPLMMVVVTFLQSGYSCYKFFYIIHWITTFCQGIYSVPQKQTVSKADVILPF